MTRPRPAIAALLGLVAALAGCQGGGAGPDVTVSPLADCQGLTEPPGGAAAAGTGAVASAGAAPAAGAGTGEPLPDLTLPCFTGGEPFRLADLRGPAVVNLWASWCAPCREELPALQRYADQAAGRVHMLGVVTEDPRPAAAAELASDLGIRFPALEDRRGQLGAEIGGMTLPVTLLVDATGQLRYLHPAPLDQDELARLVAEHLGVPE